jgi:bifunctional UDP-N-acetylglucosamine pyrophosphorylase/glucosamine-1-phosphate N-acetyltransferase
VQEPQLGTGHALLQTRPLLDGQAGRVLLLSGDVPLLTATSVAALLHRQASQQAAVVVATARVADPTGYGRIVRTGGRLERIVEHGDASADELAIDEINSGVYVFQLAPLFDALARVGSANAQGEYYLPDLVDIYRRDGRCVEAEVIADADEIRGINTRAELADVGRLLQARTNRALMAGGVTLVDPATAYIGPDVTIGEDSVIHPFVCIEGRASIGANCELHAGVRVVDSTLADGVTVFNHSVLTESSVATGSSIGPFARLRPQSNVGERVHIGNFVEIKKSDLGSGTKIGHLSYVGDATIGSNVNIGAGTITCNFDGQRKHQTVIGDGAFVGSDSTLVAPVTIGSDSYVAAGSSITHDVPDGGLGIARGRQTNKPGWVAGRAAKGQSR